MMTERKLLVGPDPDGSTFAKAFSKAARLPTQEDREVALESSVAEMRKELHRPEYQPTTVRDSRRPAGNGTGWQNEIPIGTPEGIGLIDKICDAHLPQPPHVTLRGFDPKLVREKLAQAVASGKITRSVMEEQLALLGLGPDEPQPELVE
jgi:hypothetical protein